jgi:site-specific DNA recombinase
VDALLTPRQLDPPWGEHFPAEQAQVLALLVERVDVELGGLNI